MPAPLILEPFHRSTEVNSQKSHPESGINEEPRDPSMENF